MLAPFLVIGIGGSGGKTLRTARAALRRQLLELGWEEDVPDAWQFLHIDVPTVPDGMDPDLPGGLPSRDYAGLVGAGVTYKTVDRILTARLPDDVNVSATAGWRPMAEQVQIPIDKGAGQFRAIGRVITVTHLDQIKTAIEKALGRLRGPEVKGQLQRVAALLGADETQEMPEPTVVIVSSVAGGSGAGAVVDVAWTVRAAGITPDHTFSILYAPDVFDGIPQHLRKGVRPNALATLAELCAAWWNDEGIQQSTHDLYSLRGVTLPQSGDSIPRMILVGRRNQSVDYTDQNQVYVAMGRSIAAWMSNEVVQDEFSSYFVTNAAAASLTTSPEFPASQSFQTPPFRGIGFARVSLGRDLFGDYAMQWLARRGVEVALRAHHALKKGVHDNRTDRELIEEAGDVAFRGFVIDCGLNERGYEHNQVLDALEPPNRLSLFDGLVGGIMAGIRPAFNTPDGLDADQVRFRIVEIANQKRAEYLSQERSGQQQQGRKWVQHIQSQVARAVARSLARSGALVTSYMLERLIRTEIPFVVEELRHEANREGAWTRDIDSLVQQVLNAAAGAKFRYENPMVAEGANKAAVSMLAGAKEELVNLAGELIDDLSENYLKPLKTGLDYARQRLAADEEPEGAQQSEVMLWPTGNQVPKRLRASSNEFLLEPTDTFPTTLQKLISASVPREGAGDPVGGAVASILIGADIFEEEEQNLVSLRSTWVPERYELRTGAEPPRQASVEVSLGAEDILDRARAWTLDRQRKFGQFMAESLGDYLSEAAAEPEEAHRRRRMFEGQLGSAVRAAEPLIDVDNEMLQQVHGQVRPSITYLFSEMPFRDGAPARSVVDRVLTQTEGSKKYSFEDSAAQYIDVFALMDATLQPVVIESLMRPIAEDWAAAKMNPATRESFWRWRRARSLPEFIPLAPAVRRAMVRGYFTALLLGRMRLPKPGEAFAVFDAEKARYVEFPHPLLQADVRKQADYVAVLLKSIPLAWLNSMVQRNLSPMRPYRVLLELGGRGGPEATGSVLGEYVLNADLEQQLVEGSTGAAPSGADAGVGASKGPKEEALERIGGWIDAFSGLFADAEKSGDPYRTPKAYELRDDIIAALNDLKEAVRRADTATGTGGGFT